MMATKRFTLGNSRLARRITRATLLGGLALISLAGCARYEYRLLQPPPERTITRKAVSVNVPPLDYQMRESDRHVLIAIANPTDSALTLAGAKSYVVDPRGEAHALAGASIAPRSFVRLILPPRVPAYRAGPSYYYGWGYGYWGGPYFGDGFWYPYGRFYDPYYYWGPRYYVPANLPGYWDWKTGQVRLHLLYDRAGTNAFKHEFLFERRRVK